MSLQEWRVTTGDPEVADAVAALYGGTPQAWQTKSSETLEVMTTESSVKVLLDGPNAIRSELILWGRNNQPIRKCDGITMSDGQKCVCPSDVNERREAAKTGSGCDVSIQVMFSLADNPDLGLWRFNSSSWTLAREVSTAQDALEKVDGLALAELSLVEVNYTTRSGQNRNFTKPVITILGSASDG